MHLVRCFLYVALIGLLSNPVAARLPRSWFPPDKFPYRAFAWERDGKIYEVLRIRAWKDYVPDMSKLLKNMVRKEVGSRPTWESLDTLARETCIAEAVHAVLLVLSLGVLQIWPGAGGWIFWGLCVIGNVPFILIQRFNRPRIVRTRDRMKDKEKA